MQHFTKMDNQMREWANKDESSKKWKVITLEVKLDVVRSENGDSKDRTRPRPTWSYRTNTFQKPGEYKK